MNKKSKNEVIRILDSSYEGLSEKIANERLIKYGKNILEKDKKINPIKLFLSSLINPLVMVLLAGFILSLILKEYSDAIIIFLVVILNALLSTIQEFKAEKALKSLSKLTTQKALVLRNNKAQEIDASNIVKGDVLILESGRNISADARLLTCNQLMVDESTLTGESIASIKDEKFVCDANTPLGDQKNMVFASTSVVKGNGLAIVCETGMNTQIGKIATLLKNEKKSTTPLQKKLNEISKVLAISTLFICVFIFLIAILQKRDKVEMLITAISLAVAVIPEGLLAVVTIVLSLGVQKLSIKKAIVKKLPSVETLGCVNVICSDKTGTLTLNQMEVNSVMVNNKICKITDINNEIKLLALGVVCCNDASKNNNEYIGDPTEIALFKYAESLNTNPIKKSDCIPFDSERKMMSTLNPPYQFSKGALDKILPLCSYYLLNGQVIKLDEKQIQTIEKLNDKLTMQGLRVIALAYKKTNLIYENNLIFVGLACMIDPPRSEVYTSINNLKKANVSTIMITGDHKNTAYAIGKKLNIVDDESQVITGKEIDEMDEKTLKSKISNYKIFARVSPSNKVCIVKALQDNGNVVAMTGDGVNDAPSLKKADIGISMGISGCDVSKNASDMILMDDNFSTIENAVKEGRGIFNNIKKTLLFLLSSNIGEVLVMLIAILLNLPVPLIAIHILWVNLLTDTLPSLALGQDIVSKDVMNEKPRNINESIFANKGWQTVIFYGIIIGFLSICSYFYIPIKHLLDNDCMVTFNQVANLLRNNNAILLKSQTFAFSTLALSQLFHSFGIKNINTTIFKKETLNNKLLIISLMFGVLIQLAVTMIPFLNDTFKTANLSFFDFFNVLLFSMIPLIVHEIILIFRK